MYRSSPDAMRIQKLNLQTHHVSEIRGSHGLWTPRCSPDGRYLCAMTTDFRNLRLFDFTTMTWTQLAEAKVAGEPTWSKDSRYVYFADSKSALLLRVRVSDRKIERLASVSDLPLSSNWTGLAPDGSPLVLRNVTNQDIYSLDWRLR